MDPAKSEQMYRALALRDQGLSYPQIGRQLGLPKHTVAYLLQRAKWLFGVDKPQHAIAEAKARGLI